MSATPRRVSLTWLLEGIAPVAATDAEVEDLTLDSRAARAGSLFFALRGRRSHGLEFAAQAVAQGARVVLWEPVDAASNTAVPAPALAPGVFAAPVPGLSDLLGRIADRFFGEPSRHLRVIGITGTNGKTTCAYLLAQCLERLARDAAYIGTLGWGRCAALQVPTHTTPDVLTLHRQLAELEASGVRDVALEVSSHALDQGRVAGVRFACAAFTNLTRDHLDYHGTMEAYGDAKARLFAAEHLEHAVINCGDAFGLELARRCGDRPALTAVWVGDAAAHRDAPRRLYAHEVTLALRGLSLAIGGSFGERRATARLLGRFNAENCVVVLGCLAALGVSLDAAADALAGCQAPPGRMEVVGSAGDHRPLAVIDYAHTPDALTKALTALREHCTGALWCVFGCGGDRDAGKRPLMGAVADALADEIIITDDNPRSEDPAQIAQAVAQGVTRHRPRIINDRREAIAAALGAATRGDMVLIAGKGHEDYQIYGATRRRFSDRSEAQRILGEAA